MGTTYEITAAVAPDERRPAEDDVAYVLDDINHSLSTYLEGSLISRINASRDTSEVHRLDPHFLNVYREARSVYEATNGAFNPAVGPLVRAWGFAGAESTHPDSQEVARLLALSNFDAFELVNTRPPGLKKHIAEAELDFSAIAKGYAVDEIGRTFEGTGVDNYLVEIGGEVRARGHHPEGRNWHVGIEKPLEADRQVQTVVDLENVSIATSGNYRNFYIYDGRKVVHTINPETGYPEMNRLLSATAMTSECMTADAYATALMVMGFERARAFSSQPGSPDVYLIAGGDSTAFEVFASDGFRRFLVSE